jgi:hypothetical protein
VSETFITGVDFVYVPTQSFDTAVAFYGDVLRLPCSARYGRTPGADSRRELDLRVRIATTRMTTPDTRTRWLAARPSLPCSGHRDAQGGSR